MAREPAITDRALKHAVEEVLSEKLAKDPSWLRSIVAEIMEDAAMIKAIRRGRASKSVSRAEVFRRLNGEE